MTSYSATYAALFDSVRNGRRILHKSLTATRFGKNLLAFGGAEMAIKLSRIVAIIFVARSLSAEAMGAAAICLSCHELIRLLTNNGVSQFVIRSEAQVLEVASARAHQLNWVFCLSAALIQVCVGAVTALLFNDGAYLAMGAALSLVFVGMPFGLVRIFRAMRRNRMDIVARINMFQVSADNILCLVLAVSGFGAWALVAPKILTFPIWLVLARRSDDWTPSDRPQYAPLSSTLAFCLPILMTESVKGLRLHVDKLLIGGLLGVEALGVYYFAYSCGLGFSQTLTTAFASVVYPHLCNKARENQDMVAHWRQVAGWAFACGLCVFGAQAAAAQFYVPIVFGVQWTTAAPIAAILCLAAPPRLLGECASQLARATGVTQAETRYFVLSSILSIAAITVGAAMAGLIGAAVGLALGAWICEAIFVQRIYSIAAGEARA